MNDIHKEPLFTYWPDPFSDKSLKECFGIKEKKKSAGRRSKTKEKMRNPSPLSYFFNLSSTSY